MRRVLIIGAGKRVLLTALPAMQRVGGDFSIAAVYAKHARQIEVSGKQYKVCAINDLGSTSLADVNLIYVAVAKDAVPSVLAQLADLDVSEIDLLIETPVVRVKHIHHVPLTSAFRSAWVAEDSVHLPWITAAHDVVRSGAIGSLESIRFHQSAYGYHGIATARTVLGEHAVRSAKRSQLDDGTIRRTVIFEQGREASMIEPRDYSKGNVLIIGSSGSIADVPRHAHPENLRLYPVIKEKDVMAIAIGDRRYPFDNAEIELMAGDSPSYSLTARMSALKRVAFLRLFRQIVQGNGGYPLQDALEDVIVDFYLKAIGRYRAGLLTDSSSPLAQTILRLAGSIPLRFPM